MTEVMVVADLGFGDGGKGTVVDFLVRDRGAGAVVRWHGGAQAGHRVVTPDGRAHVFAQLGAGSFVPGVRTHLAGGFVLDPPALLAEARRIAEVGVPDALERLEIDGKALVITPFARAANRLRELARGEAAHGSCGLGFGETVRLSLVAPELRITVADLHRPASLPRRLQRMRDFVRDELEPIAKLLGDHPIGGPELAALESDALIEPWIESVAHLIRRGLLVGEESLAALLRGPRPVVFEGAQGALLDEWEGFHPHTTWSTCGTRGASELLDRLGHDGPRQRLGVLRTYSTRHGQGPLPTETGALAHIPEAENGDVGWQGRFRRGWLDLTLLRYALRISPVDGLALTHLDRVEPNFQLATALRAPGPVDPALAVTDPTDGTRILSLHPAEELEDLAHQEALTELLGTVEPELVAVPDAAHLIGELECGLGERVVLTSSGASATSKRWVAPAKEWAA